MNRPKKEDYSNYIGTWYNSDTENEITKTVNVSISVKKKTEETDEPQLQC